jgi:hypothetical protein
MESISVPGPRNRVSNHSRSASVAQPLSMAATYRFNDLGLAQRESGVAKTPKVPHARITTHLRNRSFPDRVPCFLR